MKDSKIWLVYVGGNKDILPNYRLGMSKGIWGFNHLPKEDAQFWDVSEGDTILFAHKMYWPKEKGKSPGWFPKFCSNVDEFICNLTELVVAKVTKSAYETDTPIWPDKPYPYRFNFEIQEVLKDIAIRPDKFDIGYSNAIMLSIGDRGKVVSLTHELKSTNKNKKSIPHPQTTPTKTESKEGKIYYRLHKGRERDTKIPIMKKQSVFESTGDLCCEVCEFSFYKTYGERGFMYAECHHKNPLADLKADHETSTKPEDLAIVCSNCHRIIHRQRPWLSIDEMKALYEEQRNQ